MSAIILIPARMASTRLPNKPLALIGGEPMIVKVWRQAVASKLGDVVVACDGEAIAGAITQAGGKAVLTDANLPSGSDRIFQALQTLDPKKAHDIIINVQGDMPTLDPNVIGQVVTLLANPAVDIATLAAEIKDEGEKQDPAVVKIALAGTRALYFSRATIPHGVGPLYHHIGIYGYRRSALERFVSLPPSALEQREKLEQLRALEAGMRIDVAVIDTVPLGVDTPETLEKARQYYDQHSL
ncbi:MAG: 3-deoxy-manno-octulosonate cytidylyltransferase [Rickettsiales bacterium]|nr:3-deoxy-manno-octulosonate cytidylyltransferase [Rickettsiales bacterium]